MHGHAGPSGLLRSNCPVPRPYGRGYLIAALSGLIANRQTISHSSVRFRTTAYKLQLESAHASHSPSAGFSTAIQC